MKKTVARTLLLVAVTTLALVLVGCAPRVPDVTGMPADDAVRALEDAGYKLGDVVIVYTSGVKPDTVAAQKPAAGQTAREGTAVELHVAKPLGALSVPDLMGMDEVQAMGALCSVQMTGTPVRQSSDTVPTGQVFQQVPEAGAQVNTGAQVIFAVSSGKAPATVKVPKLTGLKDADANAALKNAGLVAGKYQAYNDTVAKGVVAGQDPASGASVAPGSKVGYVVSLGKAPSGSTSVSVPNVKGKSQADAEAAIEAAGLTPSVVSDTNAAPKGTVAGQMPPAGSATAKGGVVGILVSLGAEAQVAVPDVKGMTADQAKAAIGAAGMVPYPVDLASDTVPEGQVIGQQPPAGDKVTAGWPVMYAVSSGVPADTAAEETTQTP